MCAMELAGVVRGGENPTAATASHSLVARSSRAAAGSITVCDEQRRLDPLRSHRLHRHSRARPPRRPRVTGRGLLGRTGRRQQAARRARRPRRSPATTTRRSSRGRTRAISSIEPEIPAMARTSRSSSAAGEPSTCTAPPRTTRSTSFRTPPRLRQARRRTRAERPPPDSIEARPYRFSATARGSVKVGNSLRLCWFLRTFVASR